jgi:hypothetical protein
MRTVMIILGGLSLLAFCLVAGRYLLGSSVATMIIAAKIFIPIWLAFAAYNMYVGVAHAGYSVAEETPILLVIFAIPTAVAGFVWWKFS